MAIIRVYVHKMMKVVQQWTCCSSEFLLKNACILQLILSCYSIYKIYQKSTSVLTQIQKQTRKLFIKCMKLSALNKNLNGTIQFTTNSLFFWYADMIWLLYCQKVVICTCTYLNDWMDHAHMKSQLVHVYSSIMTASLNLALLHKNSFIQEFR